MARNTRYGNFFAHRAAFASRAAHQNAPPLRTSLIVILLFAWAGCGWWAFFLSGKAPLDAAYATFTLLGVSKDNISVDGWLMEIARFAGLILPFLSVLFAFYGVVFRTLCRIYLRFAKGHVVIAGDGPAALSLAESSAKAGSVVVLILKEPQKETLIGLARQKIIVLEGEASLPATLISARAAHARHVCAMMENEAVNLRVEAACQMVAAERRGSRAKPLILHLLLPSLLLRREARDLRKTQEDDRAKKSTQSGTKPEQPRVDTRPFSLAETGVRQAMIQLAPALLDRCAQENQPCPHLLLIGFDDTNEAMAAWALTRLWSAHFAPPRVTVLSTDAAQSQSRFRAHFPQAQAHDVWKADIAFLPMPDHDSAVTPAGLAEIEGSRGAITAISVCLGDDSATLSTALSLLRAYNLNPPRPMPILMRETILSEFSKRYGRGHAAQNDGPYLVAFGQVQQIALPHVLLEGELDRNAALCHFAYEAFVGNSGRANGHNSMDHAARGGWEQLGETYRHANRGVADHAVVKIWDAGLRPARETGRPGSAAQGAAFDPAIAERLARTEHARWNADRILDGWRPGIERDNRARIHPSLISWEGLTENDKDKDRQMVSLAATLAQWLYPRGLVSRSAEQARQETRQ